MSKGNQSMITNNNQVFTLTTKHTTYAFLVSETGHLEHLYYGRKISVDEYSIGALVEKHAFAPGNGNYYNDEHKNTFLGRCVP